MNQTVYVVMSYSGYNIKTVYAVYGTRELAEMAARELARDMPEHKFYVDNKAFHA